MADNFGREIGLATADDIGDIMLLEYQGFPRGIIEKESVFLSRIQSFSDGFFLLKINKKIVGYIASEIWKYQENVEFRMFELNHSIQNYHSQTNDEIYISSMTIAPEFRHQGHGRFLFNECIARLMNRYENIRSAILIVNATWVSARRIYQTEGFEELLVLKGFFSLESGQTQDAIVMRRYANGKRK